MATDTDKKIARLEREVAKLRQEFSIFIPTEDISEYENSPDITKAFQEAKKQYPPNDSQ